MLFRSRAIERCRERGIVIPTFAQMRNPAGVEPAIAGLLRDIDMQAVDPLNLFRITWKNDVKRQGIVDSWPEDVDDRAARADWGFAPKFDFTRAFRDYLIPTIRQRYAK